MSTRLPLALLVLFAGCGNNQQLGVFNTPPSASIVSPPDGSSFPERETISFEALVNDDQDEGDALTIIWASDVMGEMPGDPGVQQGVSTYTTANLTPGNHTISITVADAEGESTKAEVVITIEDLPDAPEVEIVHPIAGEAGAEGEDFEFVVKVADSFDEPQDLEIEFKSDQDGVFCQPIADAIGVAACEQELTPGDHVLVFRATDSEGYTGEASYYFTVIAATAIDNDGDGYTEDQGDCDDTDSSVSPVAEEYYNGRDDDCDGEIDNDTEGYDDDGDGQSEVDGDCDDTDPNTYEGATETCDDADDDCDGVIDEGTICYDDDGDGWTEQDGDCDDSSALAYPGGTEVGDTVDNDCDGTIDEGTELYDDDGDCYCESGTCSGSVDGTCTTVTDGDCDDSDDQISPDATETCGDGVDNDCDGSADEQNASGCTYYYYDYDGDAYGSDSVSGKCLCSSSGYYTSSYNTDCYDYNSDANPGQTTYQTAQRGDSSYDYNCDSTESKYWSSTGKCGSWPGCSATKGWKSSTASCGSTGDYITSCSVDWFSCESSTSTYTQKCL